MSDAALTLVEVEVRAFLSSADYKRLLAFFHEQAELLFEDEQTTFYFRGDEDVRLREGSHGATLIYKDGRIHDASRQEVEVPFQKASAQDLVRIFAAMDRPIDLVWHRKRALFRWNDIEVAVDDTRDYERILELEQRVLPDQAESTRRQLLAALAELGVEETPADRIQRAYESYVERNRVREEDTLQAGRECVCGQSTTMPICDGTHSDIESGDGPKVSLEEWFEGGHEDDVLKNV